MNPPSTRAVLAPLTGVAVATSVLAVAGCGRAQAAGGTPVPGSAVARLAQIAHRAATINGDPHPAWITAVETTHAKALTSATPGDYDPGTGRIPVARSPISPATGRPEAAGDRALGAADDFRREVSSLVTSDRYRRVTGAPP